MANSPTSTKSSLVVRPSSNHWRPGVLTHDHHDIALQQLLLANESSLTMVPYSRAQLRSLHVIPSHHGANCYQYTFVHKNAATLRLAAAAPPANSKRRKFRTGPLICTWEAGSTTVSALSLASDTLRHAEKLATPLARLYLPNRGTGPWPREDSHSAAIA
ncbi:hypothetical protein HDV64DRAFT_666 [Trichoderma sp. TUCIM 5745]